MSLNPKIFEETLRSLAVRALKVEGAGEQEASELVRALFKALRLSLDEVPREGWKLVPVEPTSAMLEALYDGDRDKPVGEKWDAMLAAAPSPSDTEERK